MVLHNFRIAVISNYYCKFSKHSKWVFRTLFRCTSNLIYSGLSRMAPKQSSKKGGAGTDKGEKGMLYFTFWKCLSLAACFACYCFKGHFSYGFQEVISPKQQRLWMLRRRSSKDNSKSIKKGYVFKRSIPPCISEKCVILDR